MKPTEDKKSREVREGTGNPVCSWSFRLAGVRMGKGHKSCPRDTVNYYFTTCPLSLGLHPQTCLKDTATKSAQTDRSLQAKGEPLWKFSN
jgi:hypothetical protein